MKIGLVGYACDTGLGEKNRQMERWLNISHWLVKPHKKIVTRFPPVDVTCECTFSETDYSKFLDSVDVVLFDETPYYSGLIERAKRLKKRVVCIPALEWFPFNSFKKVDLFICPTLQCYEAIKDEVPAVYFPWPTDTERFKFKQRTKVERFLFLNGNGGWKGRKGGSVIKKAIEMWPEMPITIISQIEEKWPEGVEVLEPLDSNEDLYSVGDILINPCSIDGTGLQPREAMACGMPVISTYGKPWNELPALYRINSTVSQVKLSRVRDWYTPDAHDLVEGCKLWLGKDITEASKEVRSFSEFRSFENKSKELEELIRNGSHE